MGKLSMDEKMRIINRDLPGYRIIEQSAEEADSDALEQSKPQPETVTPSIRELRRKYFGLAEEWTNGPRYQTRRMLMETTMRSSWSSQKTSRMP